MRNKFAKFMYGRYGLDELSKFLSTASLVVIIVSMFLAQTSKTVVFLIAIALLVYSYFRIFSKNYEKRRAENAKYLKFRQPIVDKIKLRREMWAQRKEFKFFKCPSCKAVLRVPKGKGKIRVVCKKCGTAFEKKT
ncbi:MAG: hypothetical protein CVU91_08615 [Firmicutes bacterium HGW-Firmicutes-16]|nr:MAG: hypothetical protein CVU91_08615 [Firmicutes bacterium HGW-Firmicutes-16]